MKNLQFLIFSILFMTAFERGFADEEWVLDPIVKSSGFGDVCPDSAPVAGGCGYSYLQRGCSPTEGFGAIFGVDIQFYRGRYTGQWSSCYDRPPGFIFGGSQGVDPSIPSSQLAAMRKDLDFYSQCGEAGYNYYLLKGKPPEKVVDQIGIYNYGDYPEMEGRGCILTYGPDSEVPHMKYEGNLDGDNIRFIRKDAKAWGISPRPVKIDCDILVCTETYLPGDCTVLGPGHPVSKLRQANGGFKIFPAKSGGSGTNPAGKPRAPGAAPSSGGGMGNTVRGMAPGVAVSLGQTSIGYLWPNSSICESWERQEAHHQRYVKLAGDGCHPDGTPLTWWEYFICGSSMIETKPFRF